MPSRSLFLSRRENQGSSQRPFPLASAIKVGVQVRTCRHCAGALCLLLLVSLSCLPAMAALGGDLNSVQDDAIHMKATVKIQHKRAYAIHEIADKSKTVVREYVSPDGHVFGVAWQGPFLPSLSHVLGSYMQQYSAGVEQEHAKGPGRRPLMIHQPDFVLETSGHMRAYYGRAYVPDLLPEGVAAEEVR